MWRMYLMTDDARFRAEAERAEKMLDEALRRPGDLHHDVGFMWNISSGVNTA